MTSIQKRRNHSIIANKEISVTANYKVGEFVWAKLTGCKWWPAIVITSSDCGRQSAKYGYAWVFWFGDHKISEVSLLKTFNFMACFHEMSKIKSSKLRNKAILEVLEILAQMADYSYTSTDALLLWARKGFENLHLNDFYNLPLTVVKYLKRIKEGNEEDSSDESCEEFSDILDKTKNGKLNMAEFCISCHGNCISIVSEHPLFKGGLCSDCKVRIQETAFAFGDDGKNICCIICGEPGLLILCDHLNCPRSYCSRCLNFFLTVEKTKQIIEMSPWHCFFCSPNKVENGFLKIHDNWEEKLGTLYIPENQLTNEITMADFIQKKPITVLSLFDGISTGKLVLDMLDIVIDKYFSSEIDEGAIHVSKFHYKESIIYIGDVCSITENTIASFGQIDLIIGGSPCNDLSLVNPARKGLYDVAGTGCLFFDFFHILSIVRRGNPNVFYLFENVAAMLQRDKLIISSFLMHEPALIDAKYFSPQVRARYFWGNIPGLHSLPKFWNSLPTYALNENTLDDCILSNLGRKAVVDKIKTVTTQKNSYVQDEGVLPVIMKDEPDILWITEMEKIFGFPLHYTDTGNLTLNKRRELLGRAWSVPVVKTILQPLKNFFESNCK